MRATVRSNPRNNDYYRVKRPRGRLKKAITVFEKLRRADRLYFQVNYIRLHLTPLFFLSKLDTTPKCHRFVEVFGSALGPGIFLKKPTSDLWSHKARRSAAAAAAS